jgi:hypothetical protein
MNFEETIHPLTKYLVENNFFVKNKFLHFIEYAKDSATITVAYDNREYLFYTHVGQNSKSLVELTPVAIKMVFNDDSFQFQSTLTIDNLISFLSGSGKLIILGTKDIFEKLTDFSKKQSGEYTKQIIYLQNIKGADEAWAQKHYSDFIKCIDRIDKDLLSNSYLKKYKIALDKLRQKTE